MVWLGDGQYRLAPALVTLHEQLVRAYPDQEWQNSGGTGTIGDASHRAEGSASDHNPWLNNTVRALDVALTARGPSCEALFEMGNRMYGARDARIFADGYTIFNYRITDPNNPGGYWPQQGDPHTGHFHISVSTNPAGYNSTAPWPIPGTVTTSAFTSTLLSPLEDDMYLLFNFAGGIWVTPLDYRQKRSFASGAECIRWENNARALGAKVIITQMDPNQAKAIPTGASIG